VGAKDIYAATDAIADNGLRFMPAPPDSYYPQSKTRVTGHDDKALFEAIEQDQIDRGVLTAAQ